MTPRDTGSNPPTRLLEALERATPWIMVALVTILVVAGLVGTLLGAPWAR